MKKDSSYVSLPKFNQVFVVLKLTLPKISGKFTLNFLSDPADSQTSQQTNRQIHNQLAEIIGYGENFIFYQI